MRAWRRPMSLFVLGGLLLGASPARSEVSYDDGLRVTGHAGGFGLRLFARPRIEYVHEEGTGTQVASMQMDLLGVRLSAWDRRDRIRVQVMGGLAVDEPILLDSFVELRPARHLGVRFGWFRIGYDEQTTHAPFWLRMTGRSLDVEALGHWYDLGVALTGIYFDDALAFSLSISNGEAPSLENANIDFLYAWRLALRLAPLLGWTEGDLVLGVGTSWTLEPWEPHGEGPYNRSVLSQTVDLSGRWRFLSLSAAFLYRWVDPGAVGPTTHAGGWHVEAGVFAGRYVELAARVAGLLPDLTDGERQQAEVAVALNGFGDRGRFRGQVEYAYRADIEREELTGAAHRVVVQLQALY